MARIIVNKDGLSSFHIACCQDETKLVERLLKRGAPINQPVKPQCVLYEGFFPLHFAAKFKCTKTTEILLRNGADVKQRDGKKMTALHVAAKESCLETVSLLLQYGADVMSMDSNGNTPVHLAFENKRYKILDALLSVPNVANSNPKNTQGVSHFHIACTRNNVNVAKSFIENGVDLDSSISAQSDKDNNSNVANWISYSPLHLAVSHNRSKIVQLLVRSGANVEIKSSNGSTPFHLACQYTGEMFREFIEDILSNLIKEKKITRKLEVIYRKLFYKWSGSTEKLDWSSHRKEYLKIINLLLEHGSDVNSIDNSGNTPVLYAYDATTTKAQNILENNLDCSKDLHEQIVKSLSEELHERRKFILKHLMDLDANLDECSQHGSILNYISIYYEEDNESFAITKWFLEKGANVNVRNNKMITPLMQAAIDGRAKLVRMLLEYGAVIDLADPRDNSTPLMLAISRSHYSLYGVISILIDKGANPNARRSDGFTPLHVACEIQNERPMEWCLERGADVNIEDNAGRSVCCYFYVRNLKNVPAGRRSITVLKIMVVLQKHIVKMKAIGLPISQKVSSSNSKFNEVQPLDEQEKKGLMEKCETEVQLLRDSKINDNYTLRDVMFKDENSLSQLVKNPAFEGIVKSKSFKEKFPNYGYLVELNYQKGVDRSNFLPEAKILLNKLAGMRLPEICFENICKYFNNSELKETSKILSGILNPDENSYEDVQLISRKRHKRQ